MLQIIPKKLFYWKINEARGKMTNRFIAWVSGIRPAKSVQRFSDQKLANRMYLKKIGGNILYLELIVRNKWKKGAKEAINCVFDEDLELVKSISEIIK